MAWKMEARRPILLDDTEKACSYCQSEARERWGSGGFAPKNFFRIAPSNVGKRLFGTWENVVAIIYDCALKES